MSSTENKQVHGESITDSEVHNGSNVSEAFDEPLNSTLTSFEAHGTPTSPAASTDNVRKVTFGASINIATPENRPDKEKIQYTPAVYKHVDTPAVFKHVDTPAVQEVHKARQEFHVQSPSDAALSPCTQMLFGPSRIKAPSTSQPLSVLRSKQQADMPKFNNGEPLDD